MYPLISIIIPTFNRQHKISKAIDSVINQTSNNWEAIIVDNNSNDGTRELVKKYKDKRIKFFEINNKGVISKSRNYGINKSSGEFIAFLDSDDWWSPNKLNFVNRAILAGKKFIYHNHYIVRSGLMIKKNIFPEILTIQFIKIFYLMGLVLLHHLWLLRKIFLKNQIYLMRAVT